MKTIAARDIETGIADALQFVSYYHPPDFVEALKTAYQNETAAAAKQAILQILINSRLSAWARRPVCQDTGVVHVFFRMGMDVRVVSSEPGPTPSLQRLADTGVRQAYTHPSNPLRASMIRDPLGARTNTQDNTPAIVHIELVEGDTFSVTVAAKGGGGDVKARFTMLNPSDNVADWVVSQLPGMGAGWCPPGVLGIGIGGSPEQAMHLAKRSLFKPIDIHALQTRGACTPEEQLRLSLYERVNALGIGAQGLGGKTTVLDVKVATAPSHAALLPVALIPNCAATRYVSFELEGDGPARFDPPDSSTWDGIPAGYVAENAIEVDLDCLDRAQVATWQKGQLLLLSGTLYTARDAAHKRLADMMDAGLPLPVNLNGKALYYVGPVDAVGDEAVGPAGPTTATRMDKFMPQLLAQTGLLVTIGKAERGPIAIDAIKANAGAYLMAVGGAAFLVSKAIRAAKVIAFPELGMEAIYAFQVEKMPVTVAVDSRGRAIHDFLLHIRTEPSIQV